MVSGDISGCSTNFGEKPGSSQQLQGKEGAIEPVVRTKARSSSIGTFVLTKKYFQNYKARDIEKLG
ncbi:MULTISPECIES: hypothetical protein [unclassified Microcoleus]|uniref:hypothetical protein n=1 Tax=unclassified Microcoleus TaxID=2642155 RepID=UPI002FD0E2DD